MTKKTIDRAERISIGQLESAMAHGSDVEILPDGSIQILEEGRKVDIDARYPLTTRQNLGDSY